MFKLTLTRTITAAALLGAAALTVATHAMAQAGTTMGCLIADISIDTNATRLTVHCVGDTVNAYGAGHAGCAATSVELIKAWHAQSMTAMLANKKTNIWWDNTCGVRVMSGLQMVAQ